jgi:hypothetical protein
VSAPSEARVPGVSGPARTMAGAARGAHMNWLAERPRGGAQGEAVTA